MTAIKKLSKYCYFCIFAVALSGCATPTKEIVIVPTQTKPQVSKVIAEAPQKGLKRKVAIARFNNATRHGSSFLLKDGADRVGKQATDILASRLTDSGKFLMLEREDLQEIKSEQDIAGISSQVVGADYLIIGSISEFGRSTESEVGVFSRNKKQRVRAVVNVRLVDVRTGQIIFSEEGTGEALSEAAVTFGVGTTAGYDSNLDDKALSAAISKLISNLIENLLDSPWVAYILDIQQNQIIISGGKSQGLNAGDQLRVLARGKKVKNPQTGIMIELPGTEIATIKVNSLTGKGNNEVAICQIASGSIDNVSTEDLIVQEL